jgi:hypothetical protein
MTTDPPADLGPGTPGLDQLLGLLTAGPTPDELVRRNATLAMYRRNIRPVAPRRRAPVTRRMRFALAAAAAVIAFAVAAYAEALPGPVQHVAYRVLGFAGVPDTPRHSSAPAARHPGPAHHHPAPGGSTSPGTPAPTPGATGTSAAPHKSASPRPEKSAQAHSGPVTLTLATTDTQIAAGADAVFTGSVTQQGRGLSGLPVGLFEHAAGHPGRHLAATATTGSGGQAVLRVAGLTANARFWLVGPHHARSKPVRVIVIPAVSVSLTSGPRGRAVVLTAQSPEGGEHDAVVLQVQRGGSWHNLRVRLLNGQGLTRFAVRRHSAARVYRVVMIATAAHGRSVSNQVPVAPL